MYLAVEMPWTLVSERDEGGIFVFKLLICKAEQSTRSEFVIAIAGNGGVRKITILASDS